MNAAIPGLVIAALGGWVSVYSYTRWFADASDARPGMMALGCGIMLLVFGVGIACLDVMAARRSGGTIQPESIADEEAIAINGEPDNSSIWTSLVLTLGAICAFAALAPITGIFGAVLAACALIAVLARFKSIMGFALFAIGLLAFIYLVFILGLQLPMKVMP